MAISNKGKLDGEIKTLAELFQHCSICHPSKTLFAEVTELGVVENCIDEPIIFRLCSRKGKDKVDGQHHSVCLQHSVIFNLNTDCSNCCSLHCETVSVTPERRLLCQRLMNWLSKCITTGLGCVVVFHKD